MIKYQYAYNSRTEIVDVESLTRIDGIITENFTCLSCGKKLIPRLGLKNSKHFAHKDESYCSSETYIHKLAKKLFYQEFCACLENNQPFQIELFQRKICNKREIELKLKCDLGETLTAFDLTKYFPKIKIEERDNKFIPDILLTSEDGKNKLFIEIVATNYASEKKLQSKNRIIEYRVQLESDLRSIKRHIISEADHKTRFHNFNLKDLVADHCGNCCLKIYDFFVIKKDGSSTLFEKNLDQISSYLNSNNETIASYEISEITKFPLLKYRYLVAISLKYNKHLLDCYLCQNHKIDNSFEYENKPIYCNILNTHDLPGKAVNCTHFKPDFDNLESNISYLSNILYHKTNSS